MKRKSLVFDLDGTLVDSLPDIASMLNATLREAGAAELPPAVVRPMIGDGAPALVRRGLEASGLPPDLLPDRLARFLALYEADPATLSRPFPGVPEILAALVAEGRRLGVCTNKPQRATEELLRRLGLDGFFSAVVGGDATPAKKPDPRHLNAVLAGLGAAPSEAAMIGDNENDAAVAQACAIPLILVTYGYARLPIAEIPADVRIDRFADIPEALAELES